MSQAQILFYQTAFVVLLILHTFAGYSFCHLIYLQLKQYRLGRPVWGGWTWRALTIVLAINYFYFLSGYISYVLSLGRTGQAPFVLQLAHVVTRSLIGPLVMQLFCVTEHERLSRPRLWQTIFRVVWAFAVPIAVVRGLLQVGIKEPWRNLDDGLRTISDLTTAAAAVFSVLIIIISWRKNDGIFRRRRRYWYLAIIVVGFALGQWQSPWSQTLMELVVLAFVLVTVYYGERLMFFDVFAKRGLLFFSSLAILTSYLALILPYFILRNMGFLIPWITALALLPILLAVPWLSATTNRWIDRIWLKRRFSIVGAATYFEESLQAKLIEDDLLEGAECSLSHIFQSKACIDPGNPPAAAGDLQTTIPTVKGGWGVVSILPRADGIPFFSEDYDLLKVLARSLGSMLDGLSLRDQRLIQEQREQALVLSAAQSELKALRAQINPHFLFNALNTIAALIPEKPDQAEQTVEQLADVFRYTVRRSAREWVCLAEEVEFVRCYLKIEQARFGERLRVRIDLDDEAGPIRIPAMLIQTLTENAIKHGISATRGPGLVSISARIHEGRLQVRVEDNGPGFDRYPRPDSSAESSNGGYGLKNVQDRLRAHYGLDANVQFSRDAADEMTVVSFEIPAVMNSEASE